MKSIGTVYWLTILGSSGLFLWNPEPSALYGLGMSIVHWPARLLRWLRVGEYLDSLAISACDWKLGTIGEHPIAQVVILILLSLLILVAVVILSEIVWDKFLLASFIIGRTASICLCLLWFSWTSAYFSGMHLSRASANLRELKSVDMHATITSDLLLGMEPINEDAPGRVIKRMTMISKEDALIESSWAKDPHLARLQENILGYLEGLRGFIEGNEPRNDKRQLEFMVYVNDVAIRFQLARLLRIAEEGREVSPNLNPRTLRFDGPLGPIALKTNFMPPDQLWLSLLPGAQERVQTSVFRIKEGAKGLPSDAFIYFEEVDELAEAYDMRDQLIRMWYTTLSHFFFVRSILAEMIPEFEFPDEDIYGELTIFLHNSCESYLRIVPSAAKSISAGSYFSVENEIHFWLNEKSISRINARHLLEMTAAGLSQIENMAKQEEESWLMSMALKVPPDRISIVLPHELTHWAMQALLRDIPRIQPQLPIAFDEGMAVLLDSESKRFKDSMMLNLGVQFYEPEETSGRCPTYQSEIDWGCEWIRQKTHPTRSPADLVNLDPKAFLDADDFLKNYTDAWALAYLFGSGILQKALQNGKSIKETVRMDSLLSTPWAQIQSHIKNKRAPEHIWQRFEGCF